MEFKEPIPASQPDKRQVEGDIDLIKRGADYQINSINNELADELIAEQKGELYPDLATYIRLNKIIACPKEELDEETAEKLANSTGCLVDNSRGEMYYIDSDGNIANFNIDRANLKKIRSVKETAENDDVLHKVYTELESIGFKWYNHTIDLERTILTAVGKYRTKILEKEKKEKDDKFDF